MNAIEFDRLHPCPRDAEESIDDMVLCPCGSLDFNIIVIRYHVHFKCIECGESICTTLPTLCEPPAPLVFKKSKKLLDKIEAQKRKHAKAKGESS